MMLLDNNLRLRAPFPGLWTMNQNRQAGCTNGCADWPCEEHSGGGLFRRFIPTPDVAPSDADALAVTVVFNNPELTTIEPIHIEEGEIPTSTPEWNPTELGLPEDITAGLTAAVEEQVCMPQ
jgi:hypothetical protein